MQKYKSKGHRITSESFQNMGGILKYGSLLNYGQNIELWKKFRIIDDFLLLMTFGLKF